MTDTWGLVYVFVAGILLGTFFFGGLWWTVRKGLASRYAALWFMGSMLLRTGVVVLGFYFIMGDSRQRLVAALFGFALARVLVTRLTRDATQAKHLPQKAGHAS